MLAKCIQFHLKEHLSKLSKEILTNTYVDNIFVSSHIVEKAQKKCKKIKNIFKLCSMNVQEFNSNKKRAVKSLQEDDCLQEVETKMLSVT